MAKVKSFRITAEGGVPDKEIREFIDSVEKTSVVSVSATYIPGYGKTSSGVPIDPKLTVIVTELDKV